MVFSISNMMLKHQERNSNSEIIVNMFQWDLAQGDFLNREQHQKNELKQESQKSMNSSASQSLISRSCMSRRNIETNAHILQCPGSLSWGGKSREDNCTASCFLSPVPDNGFNFSTRGSLNCHGSLNHIVFSVSLTEKRGSWKEKKKVLLHPVLLLFVRQKQNDYCHIVCFLMIMNL